MNRRRCRAGLLLGPWLFAAALGCAEARVERADAGARESPLSQDSAASTDAEPADAGPGSSAPVPGDDAPPRIVEIAELTNSPPPPACVAGLPTRLPDCSPDDPSPHGIDCDGDGVLDYRVYNCDLTTAERPTLFAGSFDCEPDDPGLRHWVWRDADGDGAGTGAPLCAGPGIPEGYAPIPEDAWPYDCDDQARAVHPGAVDIWGDGFDADCSNADFPACPLIEEGQTPERVLATNGCSDGPDLYLSAIAACGGPCLDVGALWGFAGNSGARAMPGPIRLGYRDDRGHSGAIDIATDGLPPGAATSLFKVPFQLIGAIEIWLEPSDCDPENDRYRLELPGDPDAICPL